MERRGAEFKKFGKLFKHDICRIGMWVMKLKLDSSKQFMGKMAVKYGVSMTGYPLSYWKDKKWIYLIAAGFLFGEEKNKRALIRGIQKEPESIRVEMNKDFGIFVNKQPLFSEPVYDPQIIRYAPVVINKEGYHLWFLASFDRKRLEKVLAFAEKYLGAEVLKFREEKLTNISFTRVLPDLTDLQKKALEIAINNGYYQYPKKIKMEALAKKMGVSYSTYQAHLKKAEGRILPEVYRNF